ncbi:hypothetical protein E0F15_01255 [Frankia sp. B2]|nr:hypothetical protein E0F15_01255 [Frankia sp. B2]
MTPAEPAGPAGPGGVTPAPPVPDSVRCAPVPQPAPRRGSPPRESHLRESRASVHHISCS